ncbi:hypothetical protein J3E72DRAFT_204882 [Bipolaris maydis]|nr:hypothetical protein J3E72DRAFT_204882 [Bipolaris maydis]
MAELFFGFDKGMFRRGQALRLPDAWDISGQWFPYQLAEVYQLYQTELSDRNGFVFGNMMGLGKTRVCWGIILVGHIHLLMWLDREENPSGHIPSHASGSDLSLNCPSQAKYPFTCLCNPQSSIYNTVPRLAPTLASGSGKAIEAWKAEARSMGLLKSKWCNSSVPHPLRICAMDKEPIEDMKPLQEDEWVEARVKVDANLLLHEHNKNVPAHEYTINKKVLSEIVPWKLGNMVQDHPRATADRPSPTSGRFILLCGEHSLTTRIWKPFCKMAVQLTRFIHKNRKLQPDRGNLPLSDYCMVWGRTIFDEFHNSKGEFTQFSKLYDKMRETNRGYQWKSWALSGTPMENGLSEILIFITKALRGMNNWNKSITPSSIKNSEGQWKRSEYEEIGKMVDSRTGKVCNGELMARNWKRISERAKKQEFEELMKTDTYNTLIKVGADIISTFMLRRTLETRDPWGKRISRLPGSFEPKIRPCRNPNWANIISEAARRCVKPDSESPAKYTFTRNDMAGFASYPGQANYKAELMAGSGEDESPTETSHEPKELPAKALVAAYKPITQLTTYFALKKRFGDGNVLVLYGNMDERTRKDRLRQWRDPHGPRIMVISMAYAEAVTLTEANFLVLMEPQDRQAKQDQVLFRIYRIGQLADACHAYILYNPDSDIEVNTLRRQQFKTLSRDTLVENRDAETVIGHQIKWESLDEDVVYKVDGLP